MTAEAYRELILTEGTISVKEGTWTVTCEQVDAFADRAKKAHRVKKKEAADVGTQIHDLIDEFLKNDCHVPPINTEDLRVISGFAAFIKWTDENDVEVLEHEKVVCDSDMLYAGRYDLMAMVNGVKTLIDFKTSNAIYDEYWQQLSAYAGCEPGVVDIAIIRLDKETGDFEYQVRGYNYADTVAFKNLAQYYKYIKS
jgi:hypothetical protein